MPAPETTTPPAAEPTPAAPPKAPALPTPGEELNVPPPAVPGVPGGELNVPAPAVNGRLPASEIKMGRALGPSPD